MQQLELPEDSHVEGLYTDLNSVVHMVASRLFKYGLEGKLTEYDLELQTMVKNMTVAERQKLLNQCVGVFLAYSYLRIRPTKIFMMAADGVAPKSKMVQQRTRRFKYEDAPVEFFDPVVISPGTPFWDELEDYLRGEWLTTYKQHFLADLDIVYSGHREAGEGEHKIFEQMGSDIREGEKRGRTETSFRPGRSTPYQVLLGSDSDLVVVSMTKPNNIIFMRDALRTQPKDRRGDPNRDKDSHHPDLLELAINNLLRCPTAKTEQERFATIHDGWAKVFNLAYEYVNLTAMRNQILTNYLAPNDIVDFVFISLFAGNDFLPPMPEFESVTVQENVYFTDNDIELRFEAIDAWLRKQAVSVDEKGQFSGRGRGRGRGAGRGRAEGDLGVSQTVDARGLGKDKIPPFNRNDFWKDFENKERTWTFGDSRAINFDNARGILNRQTGEEEIYPLHAEALTGTFKRVLLTRKKDGGRWTFAKEDIGSLVRILGIYRQLMSRIRARSRGQSNTFIVEQKNRINYLNLLQFLQELEGYGVQFMESNATNYKVLENQGLVPDPLVKYSVGIMESGKKTKIPSLVPAAFTSLQRVMAFGIYDARYADKGLPKQTLDEMCREWLKGAQWTLRYYTDGLKSINTEWFYPYLYSPSVTDLINFIKERVVANVPGFPGIRFSLADTEVKAEKINIAGSLTLRRIQDPEDPEETIYDAGLNRDLAGVIYVYSDQNDRKIAQFRSPSGGERYIDLEQIHLTRGGKQLLQGFGRIAPSSQLGFKPGTGDVDSEKLDPEVERIDPDKLTLVESSREIVSLKLQKEFVLENAIFDAVTDVSRPYATTVESFFSIMPERALKLFLSPNLVDFVLYKSPQNLSDCFPATFEEIKEGKFYDNAAVPKIPLLSPTRAQRAVASIPALYDIEISRLNQTRRRERFIRTGKYGTVQSVEIKKAYRKGQMMSNKTALGYAAANIESHTRKRQDLPDEKPVKLDPFDMGGIGDSLGGVKAEYKAYYQTLLRKPTKSLDETSKIGHGAILTATEAAEIELYKNYVFQFPEGWLMPSELPINYNLLKPTFMYHDLALENLLYNGQRKLLAGEAWFLAKYGSLAKKVVYAGAAPGIHIPLIADMFPNLEFDLWDTEKFIIPDRLIKGRSPTGRITIFQGLFLPEKALAYRGQGILFISDIRSLSMGVQKAGESAASTLARSQYLVDRDNALQLQLVMISGAVCSMLKFRLPFNMPRDEYLYADGDILLQPWAKGGSAETRLILDSRRFRKHPKTAETMAAFYKLPLESIPEMEIAVPEVKNWSISAYENKLFYFNAFVKARAVIQNSLGIREGEVRGMKLNFDSAFEIYIWDQWLLSRFGNNITTEQRKQAVVMILNEVEKFLGKDMSSNKIPPRERRTYSLPFL